MRTVIVGAGPAGLAAAWDLRRRGADVCVIESGDRPGGLAAGFRDPRWEWSLERYYHHWFAGDRAVLGLIDELGARDRVLFPRPLTSIWDGAGFRPFDSPARILGYLARRFGPLDALRFALVGAYLRSTSDWRRLERSSADAWMRRWCGARVHDAIWRPLLVSKFGEDNLAAVNMAWLWARLKVRTPRLGTFVGGFQAFVDLLAGRVQEAGAVIRTGTAVTAIRRAAAGGLEVAHAAGTELASAVLVTSSPAALAALAPELPEAEKTALRGLRSLGAVVMILALDRRLTDTYWHNLPKAAGFPFLALVEHTNFVDARHFGGDHIVYLGDYLPAEHEHFRLSKEELLERFLPALPRFNPAFDPSWVRASWLFRTPYAQPIPELDHSRRVPPLRTGLPGLYAASMSQVYPWDRGTNFAVALGREAAAAILSDFGVVNDSGDRPARPPVEYPVRP